MRMRLWMTAVWVLTALSVGQTPARADDKTDTYAAPTAGYDDKRDGIDLVVYDSATVGIKRKAKVYTPPGFKADQKYPVL